MQATRSHAERQIVLLSAGTASRREAMSRRAKKLCANLNWLQLADDLRLRRLLTTLGPRIVDLAEDLASDDFHAALTHEIEMARRQNMLLQFVSLQAMQELAQAGIPSAYLKGPLMSEAIYNDSGRRLSRDIDLLVDPDQLQAAVQVIRKLDYEAPADYVDPNGLPLLHFELIHQRMTYPPIELHWRIHWYERSFARERLLPPTTDQLGTWRPAPIDELTALLLFYSRDGFVGLRLATDISAWWDALGAQLQPGAFDPLFQTYPALAPVVRVALAVAEEVTGLPATYLIANQPKLSTRSRIAKRLVDPNPRASETQLNANMGLIDGLLAPPGDFRTFLRRQLFIPNAVLKARARQIPNWKPKYSWSYALRALIRYLRAIPQAISGPEQLHE
jgi:hypothetical protein